MSPDGFGNANKAQLFAFGPGGRPSFYAVDASRFNCRAGGTLTVPAIGSLTSKNAFTAVLTVPDGAETRLRAAGQQAA